MFRTDKNLFTSGTKWSTNNWQELHDIIRRHGACGPQWLFNWHGGDSKHAGVANFQGRWTLPMFLCQREEIVILMQSNRTACACTQLWSPALSRRLPRKSTRLLSTSSVHISGGKAWMCYARGHGFGKNCSRGDSIPIRLLQPSILITSLLLSIYLLIFYYKTSNSEDQALKILCKNLKTRQPAHLRDRVAFSNPP